jgi:hypothetical protein
VPMFRGHFNASSTQMSCLVILAIVWLLRTKLSNPAVVDHGLPD